MRKHKPKHWLRVYCPQSGSRPVLPTMFGPLVLLGEQDLTIETSNESLEGYAGRRQENPLYHFYQEGSFINCRTEMLMVFGPSFTEDEQWVSFIAPNGTRRHLSEVHWWETFHRELHGREYFGGRVHWLRDGEIVDYHVFYAIKVADEWRVAALQDGTYDPKWSPEELCGHLKLHDPILPLGEREFLWNRDGRLSELPPFPQLTIQSLSTFHREFGDMIQECIADLSLLSFNSIENLRDLFEAVLRPLEALPDIPLSGKQLLKVLRKPKRFAKVLASLHLWWRYVFKTSLSDLKELRAALKSLFDYLDKVSTLCLTGRARVHLHDEVWFNPYQGEKIVVENVLCEHLRVHYAPEEVRDLAFWSETSGMSLSFARLWDLVPLSFVSDWGADGQKFLSNIDSYAFIFNHDVRGCTYSLRSSTSFEVANSRPDLSGVLSEVTYIRDVSSTIRYKPELYVQLNEWSHVKKQWVTATSLVVSGVK